MLLLDALKQCCADAQWLLDAIEKISTAGNPVRALTILSPQVRRSLGAGPLACGPVLETPHGQLDTGHWQCSDAGRLLLIAEATRDSDDLPSRIDRYLAFCDDPEKTTLVRGLALIDPDALLRSVALECGRTNSQQLFEALALHNPYPASVYSDAQYNQLVLKALFMDIGIADMLGLRARANPELSRMCEDYYDERTAAGRDAPADIWLAMGPCAGTRGRALMIAEAKHREPQRRYYALQALAEYQSHDPQVRATLQEQLAMETEPRISEMIQRALMRPAEQ